MELYGATGKILRINLTNGDVAVEKQNPLFYRVYMGGRNIALYYLINEVSSKVDPFDNENKIIFATSVITGTLIPGSSRFTVAAKSPLTNGYGEAEAGGWWGPELKFAGYDAVIVEGKSVNPVYIWICNDKVEIRDAAYLWGKETGEVYKAIKEELGDSKTRIVQIGPAGEKLVRFANISNELIHFAGRTGLGAVMGSKKLRALAVRGTGEVVVKNKIKIQEYAHWFAKNRLLSPCIKPLSKLGTSRYVSALSKMGILPTKNFYQGTFKGAEKISGEYLAESILKKTEGCYACPVRCKRVVEVDKPELVIESQYGGPEYESVASLGSNCGIDDIEVVCKANELCARYGMDTISTGVTISFAMECYEKGIISKEQLSGLELKFGNSDAFLKIILMIANREGIGNILAEGSYRAAKQFGSSAEKYAMTVKKQELPLHEGRGKWGVALGYAVSPTGADHLQAAHDPWFEQQGDSSKEIDFIDITDMNLFGIIEPIAATSLSPEKVRLFIHLQYLWSLHNVLDLCILVSVPESRMIKLEDLVKLVGDVTGWKTSIWDLVKAGERGITMARAFNTLSGFTSNDDILPERLHEPLPDGPLKGTYIDKKSLTDAISLYYEMMGWDIKGIPNKGKLIELGIGWINKLLSKYR